MNKDKLDEIWEALSPFAQIEFEERSQDMWNRGYHSYDPEHYAKVMAYQHWYNNRNKPKAE
jgi:hypothetical protein